MLDDIFLVPGPSLPCHGITYWTIPCSWSGFIHPVKSEEEVERQLFSRRSQALLRFNTRDIRDLFQRFKSIECLNKLSTFSMFPTRCQPTASSQFQAASIRTTTTTWKECFAPRVLFLFLLFGQPPVTVNYLSDPLENLGKVQNCWHRLIWFIVCFETQILPRHYIFSHLPFFGLNY